MNAKQKSNESTAFLNDFLKLDEIDRARVIERISTLLENEKYSAKNLIVKKEGNIIQVQFRTN